MQDKINGKQYCGAACSVQKHGKNSALIQGARRGGHQRPALGQSRPAAATHGRTVTEVAPLAALLLGVLSCGQEYPIGRLTNLAPSDEMPAQSAVARRDGAVGIALPEPDVTFAPKDFVDFVALGDLNGDGAGELGQLSVDLVSSLPVLVLRYGGSRADSLADISALGRGDAWVMPDEAFETSPRFDFPAGWASLTAVGDANGDGFDDVILSTYSCEPELPSGSYFVPGRAEPLVGALSLSDLGALPIGPRPAAQLVLEANCGGGIGAVGVGDVDGDGLKDWVTTDPIWTSDGTQQLAVLASLFYGRPGALGGLSLAQADAQWTLTGREAGDYLELVALGDVTGDGLAEIAAYEFNAAGGELWVLPGRAARRSGAVDFHDDGVSFGTSAPVRGLPVDLDGDGTDDLVLARPDGVSTLHYGGPRLADGLSAPDAVLSADPLGNFPEALGDLDGDGDDELAMRFLYDASRASDPPLRGTALLSGSPERLRGTAEFPIAAVMAALPNGGYPEEYFPAEFLELGDGLEPWLTPETHRELWQLDRAGDLNGDGVEDLMGTSMLFVKDAAPQSSWGATLDTQRGHFFFGKQGFGSRAEVR